MTRRADLLKLLELAGDAHRLDGARYRDIALDLLRMRFLSLTIDREDYFYFRLYKRLRKDRDALHFYVGAAKFHTVSAALNDRIQVTPAWDKIIFDRILRSADLPVAPLKAYFIPAQHGESSERHLNSVEEFAKYLREASNFPMFLKASCSQQGLHTLRIDSYDADSDCLHIANGEPCKVDDFISKKVQKPMQFYEPGNGWIIQEVVAQHAELTSFTGTDTISCVRLVVLLRNGRPGIVGKLLKVASPGEMTDHFRHGHTTNRTVGIDFDTGNLHCMVEDLWPKQALAPTAAPDFAIPHWQLAVETTLRASCLFPGLRLQHWDVAISDSGPVLLEVNDLGGLAFYQLFQKGLLEGDVGDALIERYAEVGRQQTSMGRKATRHWLDENEWIRRFARVRSKAEPGAANDG